MSGPLGLTHPVRQIEIHNGLDTFRTQVFDDTRRS